MLRKEHGEIAARLADAYESSSSARSCPGLFGAEQFRASWREENLPATIASVHLRTAVLALEELIGIVEIEDVFDRVFSSFCVGK